MKCSASAHPQSLCVPTPHARRFLFPPSTPALPPPTPAAPAPLPIQSAAHRYRCSPSIPVPITTATIAASVAPTITQTIITDNRPPRRSRSHARHRRSPSNSVAPSVAAIHEAATGEQHAAASLAAVHKGIFRSHNSGFRVE